METCHSDFTACFIGIYRKTSWRRTNRTSWIRTIEMSWSRITETSLDVSFETYLRRRGDVLMGRRHCVSLRRRHDIPIRRREDVPLRRCWVFHLKRTCDVAGTYKETSLRRRDYVSLPGGGVCFNVRRKTYYTA